MGKLINLAKWGVTLGKSPQTFLGAKWVQRVLDRSTGEKMRKRALRLLSLSPHYFLNAETPEFKQLSRDEYLEAEYRSSIRSRRQIFDGILKDRLEPTDHILDYGCGPGFLAKIMSEYAEKVYACDISEGALACAEVINSAPNLTYIVGTESGLRSIPDQSIDAVVSIAMVQHLTDETFETVINNCRQKLKPGGRLILQIQLPDDKWKSEAEWKADDSIKGRLKYQYGLHCFGRSEETHRKLIAQGGFTNTSITRIDNVVDENSDEILTMDLLIAQKPV
jgi:cyclopropane fatty-acyl-phospholipid synthase-like methyltransferase